MACEDRRFCASTSFRHHRIPPQLLLLYPPLPDTYNDSNHRKLAEHETIVDLLGTPLHRIASSDRERASTVLYKTHVLRQEPPFGCMQATEHNYSVASPLYTLLTIAPYVSRIELLMIAYEFCGNFTVFSPNARSEYILNSAYQQGMIPLGAGWTRVKDTKGRDTNLWKRDPLITMEELIAFSKKTAGMRGSQNLRWTAERMTGVCASPFEAQASMLFGLSRRLGGMASPLKTTRGSCSPRRRELYTTTHVAVRTSTSKGQTRIHHSISSAKDSPSMMERRQLCRIPIGWRHWRAWESKWYRSRIVNSPTKTGSPQRKSSLHKS